MKLRTKRTIQCFSRMIILMILIIPVVPVAAQSDDLDNPTPMTADSVKGRWPKDKLVSHYYSFVGGPGEIKIYFDFATDESAQNVAGQLLDADGRAFIPLENQTAGKGDFNYVQEIAYPQGVRLVATYKIKRRQKLIVRAYNWGVAYNSGSYKVRVTGDGVSFPDEKEAPERKTSVELPRPAKSAQRFLRPTVPRFYSDGTSNVYETAWRDGPNIPEDLSQLLDLRDKVFDRRNCR